MPLSKPEEAHIAECIYSRPWIHGGCHPSFTSGMAIGLPSGPDIVDLCTFDRRLGDDGLPCYSLFAPAGDRVPRRLKSGLFKPDHKTVATDLGWAVRPYLLPTWS
jgi:hypothetical protein